MIDAIKDLLSGPEAILLAWFLFCARGFFTKIANLSCSIDEQLKFPSAYSAYYFTE